MYLSIREFEMLTSVCVIDDERISTINTVKTIMRMAKQEGSALFVIIYVPTYAVPDNDKGKK